MVGKRNEPNGRNDANREIRQSVIWFFRTPLLQFKAMALVLSLCIVHYLMCYVTFKVLRNFQMSNAISQSRQ